MVYSSSSVGSDPEFGGNRILDTRNTFGVPSFDGTEPHWESWRVKLRRVQTWQTWDYILDVAAAHTSSTTHDGLDGSSQSAKAKLYLSLVSLVPRRLGLEAWRVLKEEYEGQGGNRTAAFLDLGDMLASCEKDVAQYRIAAGADLQQAVQVATVVDTRQQATVIS